MDLLAFNAVLGVLALVLLLIAIKLLSDPDWLIGFMKGVFGMAFLVAAGACGYAIYDMTSFKAPEGKAQIATLSMTQKDGEVYAVKISSPGMGSRELDVLGDQVELKIQLLLWSGPAVEAGLKPAYRMESGMGRYLTLEKDRSAGKKVHALREEGFFDFWKIMNQVSVLPFVEAKYAEAVYVPLANGAEFELQLKEGAVEVGALNQAAKSAL